MDSSRIGLLGQGCVVMILAACAGCSSSSTPPTGAGPGDASGTTTVTPPDGGVIDGTGGPCTQTYPVATAVLISVDVNWTATSATAAGMGKYYLSLLTVYNVDSNNKVTGTSTPCGTEAADLTLSDLGATATGVPQGSEVRSEYPSQFWAGAPSTNITGVIGGTNIGSSFEVDPNVSLIGIAATDPLSDPTMKWPGSVTAIPTSDWTYLDGGAYVANAGQPGLEGIFYNGAMPFVLPRTSLSATSPQVDHLWLLSRTALSLYGKTTSCTETTGTATVTQLNNHIAGCQIVDDGGPCTQAQYQFLDSNTTQYAPATGTFDAVQLTGGASATCADVLAKLPIPAPGM
jgi:hypothetical protein